MQKIVLMLAFALCLGFAHAGPLQLSFYLALADGSAASDGVTVQFFVEKGVQNTKVFDQHWSQQAWSSQFVVNLDAWQNQYFTLHLLTSPGPNRNTGYDWIMIADAKITQDGKTLYSLADAVRAGQFTASYTLDQTGQTYSGLAYGANCELWNWAAGGITKSDTIFQHPPWQNNSVGNTITHYSVQIPEGSTLLCLFLGIAIWLSQRKSSESRTHGAKDSGACKVICKLQALLR